MKIRKNLEDQSLFGLAAEAGLSPNELRRSLEAGIYRDRIASGRGRTPFQNRATIGLFFNRIKHFD
jgi:hypothetical protein